MGLFYIQVYSSLYLVLKFASFLDFRLGNNGFGLGLLYCFGFRVGISGFEFGLLFSFVIKNKLLT